MAVSFLFRGALVLLAALVLTPTLPQQVQAAPAKSKPAAQHVSETPQQIEVKLLAFASSHLQRANLSLRPNKANPEALPQGGMFVARYIEVDTTSVDTEMTPSEQPGCLYVGHVIYLEKIYECVAASKSEAVKGPYQHVKTRRVRELTRYDKGTWHY